MSKIEELLKNEKVEWKKLEEVCEILDSMRKPISKKDRNPGQYPYYGANGVQDYIDNYIFDGQFILMGEDGSVMNKDNSPVLHWIDGEKLWVNNHAHVLGKKEEYTLKYLYYYLSKVDVSQIVRGTPPKLNQANMRNIDIPIPSPETQKKIVEILDNLTNCVTELQAELQAELQNRTKQYEYYRNMLLSEEYLNKLSDKLGVLPMEGENRLRCTTLGEIGKFTRGNGLQKSDFIPSGKPAIHYGQIYTKFSFETNQAVSFISESLFNKLKKAQPKDILIATTSENIEDVGKCLVWTGEEEVAFSGDMYSYSTTENSKYIAYYFQTSEFQRQKEKKVTGTKLIRIHGDDMAQFSINVPSLPLQNKIVEILDRFQSMLSDTKGLLPTEIEQRRKQYEYYREKLLTFDMESDSKQASKQASKIITRKYFRYLKEAAETSGVSLSQIIPEKIADCTLAVKKINWKYFFNESFKYIDLAAIDRCFNKIINTEIINVHNAPSRAQQVIHTGDVLFGTTRPELKRCYIVTEEYNNQIASSGFCVLRADKEKILPKWLLFSISTNSFQLYVKKHETGTNYPSISDKDIKEYKILRPHPLVQEHLVSILDKFDILVNDISKGLPKEVELRQKQYKYYREKMLNFKMEN